jgi:hypothetical protein
MIPMTLYMFNLDPVVSYFHHTLPSPSLGIKHLHTMLLFGNVCTWKYPIIFNYSWPFVTIDLTARNQFCQISFCWHAADYSGHTVYGESQVLWCVSTGNCLVCSQERIWDFLYGRVAEKNRWTIRKYNVSRGGTHAPTQNVFCILNLYMYIHNGSIWEAFMGTLHRSGYHNSHCLVHIYTFQKNSSCAFWTVCRFRICLRRYLISLWM